VRPFRLHVKVRCQPVASWRTYGCSFVFRCAGSPVDVVQSGVTGFDWSRNEVEANDLIVTQPDKHTMGQSSGRRLPEGAATVVEALTELNGTQSTQESDSDTWTMRSALQSNYDGCLRLVWQQRHFERRHTRECTLQSRLLSRMTRGSPHGRDTRIDRQKRRATNGIEQRRLDELAQRKRVEIHDGLGSNKVDGLFELWRMNKRQVEQLAGASIKQ